jgi:CheY-like chemotaxis protein
MHVQLDGEFEMHGKRPVIMLLVEDSLAEQRLVQHWFRGSALIGSVPAVADGDHALAWLRGDDGYHERPRPDLLLLDVNLPRVGGFEVLTELRKQNLLASIPVIIMSASCSEKDKRRALELGASLVISKPSDADEFVAMVQSIERFVENHWPA